MMHPQLELLLEIQDLQMQRKGLASESLGEVETELFAILPEEAVEVLGEKVAELEARLESDVRSRYTQVSSRGPRVVVPVLNGICYGCFVAVATARASEVDRNSRVESCEHCGSFLYHPA